jgi:hypothetical protein
MHFDTIGCLLAAPAWRQVVYCLQDRWTRHIRPFFAASYALSYSLNKVKPGTLLLDSGGGAGLEVNGLGPGDIFIGFSAYPYSRMTLGVA